MILVDTSIWVDHFRKSHPRLQQLLIREQVLCHPFVIGELACGQLKNRSEIISLLRQLPQAGRAEDDEALDFVERNRLFGSGLGWIDVHLLVSALLSGTLLWTSDKRLRRVAAKLRVSL